MNAATPYSRAFFEGLTQGSQSAARGIVPVLLELARPASVVDVGCGAGAWLAVFGELGITDIHGIDGAYVDRDNLLIAVEQFTPHDLSKPLAFTRRFDLALSVEVAEHLPEESARGFVESLTRLAPVVAFSAAVPGQGGVAHLNEQWPDYWANHFKAQGYVAVDAIRHRVWNDETIGWFYRQNLIMYVREEKLASYPELARERERLAGMPLSIVHPRMYDKLFLQTRPENVGGREATRLFGSSLKAAFNRRLGRKRPPGANGSA